MARSDVTNGGTSSKQKTKRSGPKKYRGRVQLNVRVRPSFKDTLDRWCAAHQVTVTEVAVDAIGKYIGLDTSHENIMLGELVTIRKLLEDIEFQSTSHVELFLTFMEYYFFYHEHPSSETDRQEADARLKTQYPKFLSRFRTQLERGGHMEDIERLVNSVSGADGQELFLGDKESAQEIEDIIDDADKGDTP
jgi:hypothetical protein